MGRPCDDEEQAETVSAEGSSLCSEVSTTATETDKERLLEKGTPLSLVVEDDQVVWILLMLMGLGMLIPWNATLNA